MRHDAELRTLLGRRQKPVEPTLSAAVAREWSHQLRRGARDTVRRWGLHVLSLLLLIGVPYVHGRWRARQLQARYAEASACVLGGTAVRSAATGQVADPAGYFSSQFLQRGDDWPARCTGPLQALAQSPAHFVFPSVKEAEANVQKAADILLTELRAVPTRGTSGQRIPVRPLWALELLRTAVAADGVATGAVTSTVAPVAFSAQQASLPTPTLLNIAAAPDATVKVWGGALELQVAAFDQRGVSYVHLSPSDATRARLPRSGSLRSVVIDGSPQYLVWATPLDKCAVDHCAGRSMGLATLPVPLTKLPEPRWVAAHPFGSLSRSLAWRGTRMWMAAANLDGTAKLVELTYVDGPKPADGPALPALVPQPKYSVAARDLVVFADGADALGALALVRGAQGRLELELYRDTEAAKTVVALPSHWTSAWIRRCSSAGEDGATHYFMLGNATDTLVGYVRGGVTTTWPLVAARIPSPTWSESSSPSVALACASGAGISVVYAADNGALDAITCAEGSSSCSSQQLSDLADSVDITYTRDGALVAYAGGRDRPQVQLRALDRQGSPRSESFVPAPCWERWGGLCGAPSFARVGAKLVLAARSGADLMAVESRDDGMTWHELDAASLVRPPGPHVLPRVPAR